MSDSDAQETLRKTSQGPGALPSRRGPAGSPLPRQLGPYILLDELGAGGMGRVYSALHTRLKRLVALKLLPEERVNSPQAVARFQQEMEAVGQVDHPNVVRATDAGEDHGYHFLVMEYVEGLDLDRLVRRCGPLPIADACELIRQAADGLQAAHERGLVHRDVKPSNLLLSRTGQVKLLDLGLARLGGMGGSTERLTPSGEVMGTPDYMAPEQAFDAQKVDIRADLYSLGCTLYRLLAGRPPFGGPEYTSRMKKIMAHAQDVVPPVREVRPDIPAALGAFLDRLLSKVPTERPATPAETARELEPFTVGADLAALIARVWVMSEPTEEVSDPAQAGDPADTGPHRAPTSPEIRVPFPPAHHPSGAPPSRRKRWWRALLGLLSLVLVAGLGVYGLAKLSNPPRPSDDNPGDPPKETAEPPLTPGRWYDLLEQPPREIVWNNPQGDSRYDFRPLRRELWIDSFHTALLGLGRAPQPDYKLTVGIRQTNWVGGAGLFFGYRQTRDESGPGFTYQVIELAPFSRIDRQAFVLSRSSVRVRLPEGKRPVSSVSGVASATVNRPPARQEQILEITVRKSGLTRVLWNGEELGKLSAPDANARFTPADYEGEFGAYASRSASVFQNARWMLFEGGNP